MTVYLDFDSKTLYSEGKTWVDQRRFALRTLRDFGFGKQGMEEMIQDEVEMFKNLISQVQCTMYNQMLTETMNVILITLSEWN